MAERTGEAAKIDRIKTHATCNFPDGLRAAQSGHQVRRAGWPPSLLYIGLSAEGHVDLVQEATAGDGESYCFASPWLGGAAIGGPPVKDLLAEDWCTVRDSRVPTREGAEAATLELLDQAAGEEEMPHGR